MGCFPFLKRRQQLDEVAGAYSTLPGGFKTKEAVPGDSKTKGAGHPQPSCWLQLDYKAGLSDVPADAKDLAGALRIPARDVELLDPQGWQDPPTAIYLRAGAILVCLSGLRLVICKDQVTVLSVPDRHQPGVPVPPSSDHPAVQELILFLRPSQYRDSAQRRIEVDQSLPYELRALEGALSAATQDLAQHIAALEERITAVLDFLVQKVTSAKLKELLELKLALQKLSSYASRFKQELDRLLSDPRRLGEMYLTRMSGLASGAGPPGSTEPSMLGGCMQGSQSGAASTAASRLQSAPNLQRQSSSECRALLEFYQSQIAAIAMAAGFQQQRIGSSESMVKLDLKRRNLRLHSRY